MATKRAKKKVKQGVADAAPSSVPFSEAVTTNVIRASAPEDVAAMLGSGAIPGPPAGAFDGLAPGPVLVRRNGRLVPAPASLQPGYTPAPAEAKYQPGMPFTAPNADMGARFATAKERVRNSTFHEPEPAVAEARMRAVTLRQTLGMALQSLEMAYHEAMGVLEWLSDHEDMVPEIEREGIDLVQVRKFADEADDVLNMFSPPVDNTGKAES